MKKFLFILGIVIVAGAIFVGGLILGARLDLLNAMLSVSTLDEAWLDAQRTFWLISELENGELDAATSSLNVELDGHIIVLDQLLED